MGEWSTVIILLTCVFFWYCGSCRSRWPSRFNHLSCLRRRGDGASFLCRQAERPVSHALPFLVLSHAAFFFHPLLRQAPYVHVHQLIRCNLAQPTLSGGPCLQVTH